MSVYKLIEIAMDFPDGEKKVPTYAEIAAPGLAINPDLGADEHGNITFNGGYQVTHIATGRNATASRQGGSCLGCCHKFAEAAINSGIDWTQTTEAIAALIAAGGEVPDALRRAVSDFHCCGGVDCDEVDGY